MSGAKTLQNPNICFPTEIQTSYNPSVPVTQQPWRRSSIVNCSPKISTLPTESQKSLPATMHGNAFFSWPWPAPCTWWFCPAPCTLPLSSTLSMLSLSRCLLNTVSRTEEQRREEEQLIAQVSRAGGAENGKLYEEKRSSSSYFRWRRESGA